MEFLDKESQLYLPPKKMLKQNYSERRKVLKCHRNDGRERKNIELCCPIG